MATLFHTNGKTSTILPQNGDKFSLDELQQIVDGFIEIIQVNEQGWLVMDEDGKLKKMSENKKASDNFNYPLLGNVILCSISEIQ